MTRRIESSLHPAIKPAEKSEAKKPAPKTRRPSEAAKKKAESLEKLERSYTLSEAHVQNFEAHTGDQHFALANAVSPGLVVSGGAREVIEHLPTAQTEGAFEKKVRVAGGEGSFGDEASLAQGEGSWDALYAYAGGSGEASLGANGLRASGELHAGAGLIDAEGAMRVGYGPVQAEVGGRAFVGAKANLYGDLTVDPAKGVYYAEVGGQAFVGAKAGVNGALNLGPVGSVAGTAEVWAGAGVQFKAKLGLKDGHFKLKLDVGAALGVGFKLGGEISINVQPVIDIVKGIGGLFKKAASGIFKAFTTALTTAAATPQPSPLALVPKNVGNYYNSLFWMQPLPDLHSRRYGLSTTAP